MPRKLYEEREEFIDNRDGGGVSNYLNSRVLPLCQLKQPIITPGERGLVHIPHAHQDCLTYATMAHLN